MLIVGVYVKYRVEHRLMGGTRIKANFPGDFLFYLNEVVSINAGCKQSTVALVSFLELSPPSGYIGDSNLVPRSYRVPVTEMLLLKERIFKERKGSSKNFLYMCFNLFKHWKINRNNILL